MIEVTTIFGKTLNLAEESISIVTGPAPSENGPLAHISGPSGRQHHRKRSAAAVDCSAGKPSGFCRFSSAERYASVGKSPFRLAHRSATFDRSGTWSGDRPGCHSWRRLSSVGAGRREHGRTDRRGALELGCGPNPEVRGHAHASFALSCCRL